MQLIQGFIEGSNFNLAYHLLDATQRAIDFMQLSLPLARRFLFHPSQFTHWLKQNPS